MNQSFNLREWCRTVSLQQISRLEYKSLHFTIEIEIDKGLHRTRSGVSILHNAYKRSIFIEKSEIFYSIKELNKEVDFENDYHIRLVLTRAFFYLPTFYERMDKLRYFRICLRNDFLPLGIQHLDNFSIKNCTVHKFLNITEKRDYRVGRDDNFTITTTKRWVIKYNEQLISNEYLQTLIPQNEILVERESAYTNSILGPSIEEFEIDYEITKSLHNNFNIESLKSSF